MKIALAQLNSATGAVEHNTAGHLKMIKLAAEYNANLIVFPELSITSYAPELAQELALSVDDPKLEVFMTKSKELGISIGLGLPVKTAGLPVIGLLIFEPNGAVNLYGKKHLHEDELPYFSAGTNYTGLVGGIDGLALSVCYEIAIEEHIAAAEARGAGFYLASVAKTVPDVAKAHEHIQQMAIDHDMVMLMSNCIGTCEGQVAGGRSAVWSKEGELLAELPGELEGILCYETTSGTLESIIFEPSEEQPS